MTRNKYLNNTILILLVACSQQAYAQQTCNVYTTSANFPWETTTEAACLDWLNLSLQNDHRYSWTFDGVSDVGTDYFTCNFTGIGIVSWTLGITWQNPWIGTISRSSCGPYYVTVSLPKRVQCSSCGVQAPVGHPINAATGGMFDTMADVTMSSVMSFKRFYNSIDDSNVNLSAGWEHSYGRKVVIQYSTVTTQDFLQSANTSSLYPDAATACTTGFSEIKSKVSQWGDALASYSNGNCVLTKNGIYVGSVQVKSSGLVEHSQTPAAYDAVRDDGQLIRFIIDGNGAILSPPGINLKLQKTASGFIVIDGNDNVEQYDTTGKLLSVTSRTGVVQTMSYDSDGRLSSVSDSFGHQLNFSYDAQGHLSTVTR